MEELNTVDWTYDIPDNRQYFVNEEFNFDKSATFQIIKGTFQNPFISSDSEKDFFSETKKSTRKKKNKKKTTIPKKEDYIPGRRKLQIYPEASRLTPKQHEICNNVLRFINTNSFSMPRTEFNQNELKIFNELMPTLKEEQQLFNNYVKDYWMTKSCGRHLQLYFLHEKFIESLWRERLTKVTKYPQFYKMAAMLPLVYTNDNPICISFLHSLKDEGKPPQIDLPMLNKAAFLPKSQAEIESCTRKIIDGSNKRVPVHDDKNCEQLAIHHRANIVISSSGLKTLADNHAPFTRSWDLPVLVKEYKLTDAQGKTITHTVAYVDRTLPPRNLTGYQKSSWCSKLLLKFALRQNNMGGPNDEATVNETPAVEYCANCKLFAETSICKSVSENVLKDDDHMTDSESEDLIIDIPSTPRTRMTTRGMARKYVKSNEISDSPCHIDTDGKEQLVTSTENSKNDACNCGTNVEQKSASEDVSKIICDILNPRTETRPRHEDDLKPDDKNMTYKLWKIGTSQQESQLSKTLEKDIIILVRCKIDGAQMDIDGNTETLMLAPKLEYQIEFGAECVTRAETARNWTALQFRPDSKLLRARLIPQSGEIIMLEKLSLPSLTAEGLKHSCWKPQMALGCFFNIFSSLSHLNPAQYLLRHEPAHHSFAMLCISTPSRSENGIDLYMNYDLDPSNIQANQTSHWNPLDPTIVTPNLAYHGVAPCLFTPGICKTLKKQKAPNNRKDSKSKGKTKFNRKQRGKKSTVSI